MWIKWKYNDAGWRDFEELEIPDGMGGEETIEDYLIETCDLPTWSERFDMYRIKWEKLNLPPEEEKARKVKKLTALVAVYERQLQQTKDQLYKLLS